MGALGGWLSDAIVQRIGWAIIHSLWQGAAVALLLALVLHALRRRGAQARYLAACAALAAMVVLPVVTASLVSPQPAAQALAPVDAQLAVDLPADPGDAMPPRGAPAFAAQPDNALAPAPPRPQAAASVARPAPRAPAPTRWYDGLDRLIEPALPALAAMWLVGVAAMSLWHGFGWIHLHRTKRRGSRPASRSLQDVCRRLAHQLRVSRPVRLLESAVVAAPVVVGWLRPVILMPVGAVTGLTPAQLEAVLAHELAHIRRYDCLVRLAMAVVETLLFYHPAVWWISSRVRDEAEHCCDEMAVAVCGNRRVYATALARAAELGRRPRPRLAAAADGGRLLPRIRRILGVNVTETGRTRTWVAGPLVLAALVAAGIAMWATMSNGRTDDENTGPARFLAVRPNCDDDLFDADGEPAGTLKCLTHRMIPWNHTHQPRDFIFELPPGDEPVTPVWIYVEPAGGGMNFANLGDVHVERRADGRRVAVASAELPSTYKGALIKRDLDAVDVSLAYYHGPRGEPDATFAGPFAAGVTRVDDGGKDYTLFTGPLVALAGRSDAQGVGTMLSVSFGWGVHRTVYPPCIAYDDKGDWHLGEQRCGSFGGKRTQFEYWFPGLPLERIARLTFNEKPFRATARNVTVYWPDVSKRTYPAYLDTVAARLGIEKFDAQALYRFGTKSPEDAMKCIDLVRDYMAQTATSVITQGQVKPEDFPPEQQAAAREAAKAWLASEVPELRGPAVTLGLWGKWPEFVEPAVDLVANEPTSHWRSEVGEALQRYAANLTDAEIERLGELVLAREDDYVQEFLGRRILRHARGAAAEAVLAKLAHSPKIWCWRLGIQGLRYQDPDHKYEALRRLLDESPELAAKVALTVGDILGRSDYPRERQRGAALAAELLTPELWRVDSGSWHSLLSVVEAETDAATATNTMIGFLERLVDEWDLSKTTGRSNTNYVAVSFCVVRLNRLNGVNLGNLGPQDGRHSSEEWLHDWRALAAAAVRWKKTGADPSLLPTGWVPQTGDVRLVWLNKNDPEKSRVAPWSPGDAETGEVYIPLLCERTGKPQAESERNTDFVSWRLEQSPAGGGPRTLHARAGVIGRHSRTYAEPLADGSRPQRVLTSESPEWLGEWEVWIEPAGATNGKLAGTKLFESWKARYLAGPLAAPLPCVVAGPLVETAQAAAPDDKFDDKQARARLVSALAMARAIGVQFQAADKALREGDAKTAATLVRDALKQEGDFKRLVAGTLAETLGNLVIKRARALEATLFYGNLKEGRQHMDAVQAQGTATVELLEGLVAGGLADLPPAIEGGAQGEAHAALDAAVEDAAQAVADAMAKDDAENAAARTRERMARKGIHDGVAWGLQLQLTDTTRSNVLWFLTEVAKQKPREITILVDRNGIEADGVDLETTVTMDAANLSLEEALGLVLRPGLAYAVLDNGSLLVSTPAGLKRWQQPVMVEGPAENAAVARTRERLARKGMHDDVDWSLRISFMDSSLDTVLRFLGELAKAKPREIKLVVDREGLTDDGVDLDQTLSVDVSGVSLHEALKLVLGSHLAYIILNDGSILISTPARLARRAAADAGGKITVLCRNGALVLSLDGSDEQIVAADQVTVRSADGTATVRGTRFSFETNRATMTVEPRKVTVVLPQETVPLDAGDTRFTAPDEQRTIAPGEGRLVINERTVIFNLDESRTHVRMSIGGQKVAAIAKSITVAIPSLKVLAATDEPRTAVPTTAPRGVVVDALGKPVAGARVMLYYHASYWGLGNRIVEETTSDGDGKFALARPMEFKGASGTDYTDYYLLCAVHPDYALAWQPIVSNDHQDAWTLNLTEPAAQEVLVTDIEGRPMPNATVWLTYAGRKDDANELLRERLHVPEAAGLLEARTDDKGIARLGNLPRTSCVVSVSAAGMADSFESLTVPPDGQVTITLKPASTVSGRVATADGSPVAGAVVWFWADWNLHWATYAVTDAQGRYSNTKLVGPGYSWTSNTGNGRYKVRVKHDDYATAEKALEVGPGSIQSAFDLTMAPGTLLRIKVLEPETDKPIAGARCYGSGDPGRLDAYSDRDGLILWRIPSGKVLVSFGSPPGGTYVIEPSAGNPGKQVQATGDVMDVTLYAPSRLRPLTTVCGRVLFSDGRPAAGLRVCTGNDSRYETATFGGSGGAYTATNADGSFELDRVPVGLRLFLCAMTDDRAAALVETVDVPEDHEGPLVLDKPLVMKPTVAADVLLTDELGNALPHYSVRLRPMKWGRTVFRAADFVASADDKGRLKVNGIVPGLTYQILDAAIDTSRGGWMEMPHQQAVLAPGSDDGQAVQPPAAVVLSDKVVVRVVNADGKPLPIREISNLRIKREFGWWSNVIGTPPPIEARDDRPEVMGLCIKRKYVILGRPGNPMEISATTTDGHNVSATGVYPSDSSNRLTFTVVETAPESPPAGGGEDGANRSAP
ncbi:MAG: M48 family metalloprotease [Planctomycetes bacterium]|nr:M48 family metalloprotease [Planctomycetota bacterium]